MKAEKITTKKALAARLRKHLKVTQDSAERQVARWTSGPKPVVLDQKSRAALRAVLKDEPPSDDVGREEIVTLLKEVIGLLHQVLARIPPPKRAAAASGRRA